MQDLYESLSERVGCPPDLRGALEKLVPEPQASIALLCRGREVTPREAAEAIGADPGFVAATMEAMYRGGILRRPVAGGAPEGPPGLDRPYACNSFHTIVDEQLGRDLAKGLDAEEMEALRDYYYRGMQSKRDRAISQGLQTHSSRVLALLPAQPQPQLQPQPHAHPHACPHPHPHEEGSTVIVPGDAREAARQASEIALTLCSCRLTFRRCRHSLETCLYVDGPAQEMVERGIARRVGMEEVDRVLRTADDEGLVLLAVLGKDDQPYAICSCCRCCCHDLRSYLEDGRTHWIAPSGYVAEDDDEACVNCGTCVKRCVFGARALDAATKAYDPARCFGCGVCVSTCPTGAIGLVGR